MFQRWNVKIYCLGFCLEWSSPVWLHCNTWCLDKILTVAERSMWKILDKGISECKACGRKKPTTSATRARLSWKGIVTHSGGGSSSWLFIVSVMSRLFCKFDTCSASLWTTKLFPTPGWSEVTTWTFKLKKKKKEKKFKYCSKLFHSLSKEQLQLIIDTFLLEKYTYWVSSWGHFCETWSVLNRPTFLLDQLLQQRSKTRAVHSTNQASCLVLWTASPGKFAVRLADDILACRLPPCTALRRSLYELVLRFHCYIGQQEQDLETSKMKHFFNKRVYFADRSRSENGKRLLMELMNLLWKLLTRLHTWFSLS